MTQLADLGAALWGEHWVSPMARALGVSYRTVARWANGQNEVPPSVIAELREILRHESGNILQVMSDELRQRQATVAALLERRG